MKTHAGLSFLLMIFLLSSCNTSKLSSHSSMNSLDWEGIYSGVVPCADCEGIFTVIELKKDNYYSMSRTYLGKRDRMLITNGKFTWDKSGGQIILGSLDGKSQPTHYRVGENTLVQLDLEGVEITGAHKESYILHKGNDDIANKYWRLVKLGNSMVTASTDQIKEPHMILRYDNTVNGNGGCNNFRGSYTLSRGHQVKFSALASTKMLCADSQKTEDQFMKVLHEAQSYRIANDSLYLSTGVDARTATFVAVYFK